MGKQMTPKDARLYRLCSEALYYLWDPIGIAGNPEARDEYDMYLSRAFALVRAGSREGLIEFLADIQVDRMGLGPDQRRAEAAAEFMMRARAWVDLTAPEEPVP
jgi:hypothetical protein